MTKTVKLAGGTPRFLSILLLAGAFAGCVDTNEWDAELDTTEFQAPDDLDSVAARDVIWPNFDGATLRILDHGAFAACEDMGALFEELTNATVTCTAADDTGSAINRAIQGIGDPEFDVIYGIDNLLMQRAVDAGLLREYTPQMAARVNESLLFFADDHEDHEHDWPATPVDHGYIALNIDHRHAELSSAQGPNTTIENLFTVRKHADLFVTQDPRTSTPGLGFLLTTIKLFGEDDAYDWQDYWTELFEGGVKITADWSTAYEVHFSGGYGMYETGHIGDRPIVTSYTESPAYEAYWGATEVADVLVNHGSAPASIHQIQTMGILDGTPNLAVAQAWLEFSLTDDFQVTAAPYTAVYPAVDSEAAATSVADTYESNANVTHYAPGTFATVSYDFMRDGAKVESWVAQWVTLCETHNCA